MEGHPSDPGSDEPSAVPETSVPFEEILYGEGQEDPVQAQLISVVNQRRGELEELMASLPPNTTEAQLARVRAAQVAKLKAADDVQNYKAQFRPPESET